MTSISSSIYEQTFSSERETSTEAERNSSASSLQTALIPFPITPSLTAGQMTLGTLPPGVLKTSASFLSFGDMTSLSKVCRLFHNLITQSEDSLPIHVRMQLSNTLLTSNSIKRLTSKLNVTLSQIGECVRKFSIQHYEEGLTNILKKHLPFLPKLDVLILSPSKQIKSKNETNISKEDIALIAAHCQSLTTFECCSSDTLQDDMLKTLADQLPDLDSLNVSSCFDISDAGILPFIQSRAMKKLDLSFCRGISNDTVLALAKNAAQLQVLGLARTRTFDTAIIDKEALKTLFAQCTELREVDLSQCPLDDETFCELLNHAPKLRKIKLTNCQISDEAIQLLVEKCPHLEELFIDACNNLTDASLDALTQCKCLTTLDINENQNNMSAKTIETFKKTHSKLKVMQTLMDTIRCHRFMRPVIGHRLALI